VVAGKVKIQYCPTEEMLADFFMKQLQGSIFQKCRAFILNPQGDLALATSQDHRSVLRKHSDSELSPTGYNHNKLKLSGSGPLKYKTITNNKIPGSAPTIKSQDWRLLTPSSHMKIKSDLRDKITCVDT
jgi:hypothetical protein